MTTFIELEDLALARHFDGCRATTFERGELVCDVLGASSELYLIASGVAQVSLLTPEGAERSLFYETAGSLLGDANCFAGPVNLVLGVRAVAITELAVLRMGHGEFRARCRQDPELALEVLGWAYRKVACLIKQVEMAAFHDTTSQLAALILAFHREMVRLERSSVTVPLLDVTHQELATATGRSRVSVTYAMNRLVDLGAIRSRRGRIDVLNAPALEAVATAASLC